MKPTVGRIVHIRWGKSPCEAAIVTGNHGHPEIEELGADDDVVSAMVFSDLGAMRFCDVAVYQEAGDGGSDGINTWHWPERVEE